ncbi:hypothetical protein VN97_g8045 [Penicillium thymicola]|uniref:Uncharacterized protein n=1 Tax=Penicillium thymicola TaxID=293382 RepID=A0AAI9TE20_PENTH|nr:hypothetical protein VN97_g8045 [Penicillium thymicola]
MKFDDQGEIVNTISTLPCGGPFRTYSQFVRGMRTRQFKISDRSTHLNGCRGIPGLRERFPFLEEGVEHKWKLALAWDNALSDVGVEKPSTIDRMGYVADIWWLSQDLFEV